MSQAVGEAPSGGYVPLAEAAIRLKLSAYQTLRLVFIGELRGMQKQRRWLVSEASLATAAATRSGNPLPRIADPVPSTQRDAAEKA